MQALNPRTIWGSIGLLRSILIFCWNLTGTQVNSWSGTVIYQSYNDNQHLSCGIDRTAIKKLSSKSARFFVISIKLLAKCMGQTLERGHHYRTEKVLFITNSIILIWLFSLIYTPNTYYCLMSCLSLSPYRNIRHKPPKSTDSFFGRCYFIYSFYNGTGFLFCFVNISKTL